MILAVYDVATDAARKKVERLLRQMSFVFLFRNARWARRPVDVAALIRHLRSALRGQAFRILIVEITGRCVADARWLHGSTPRSPS